MLDFTNDDLGQETHSINVSNIITTTDYYTLRGYKYVANSKHSLIGRPCINRPEDEEREITYFQALAEDHRSEIVCKIFN